MERNVDEPELTPQPANGRSSGRTHPALRFAAEAADHVALDRLIVTLAAHEAGASFERAELWLWDPAEGRLRAGATATWSGNGASLESALERVRFGGGESAHPSPRRRALALEPLATEAWRAGEAVVRPGSGGTPSAAAVPIRRPGGRYGVVCGTWTAPWPSETREVAMREFTHMAEDMIVRHGGERHARRTTERLAALAELARAGVSSQNLTEMLHVAARLATQATGAEGSAVWIGGGDGPPRLSVTYGPPSLRDGRGTAIDAVVRRVVTEGRPHFVERATDEPALTPEAAAELSAFGVCPLRAFDRTLGAIAVYAHRSDHPAEASPFGRDEREFLGAVADLVAGAADGSARFRMLGESGRRERELSAQLRREERASGVAELAMRALRDARRPAASIRVFAARLLEELAADARAREYVEIVAREAERLERLLDDPGDATLMELPRLRMESVNEVVQEALGAMSETLVRRRVRLVKRLSSEVPKLLLDPARMRQVIGGILQAAVEDIGPGGRVKVSSRRAGGTVVVEVAHDGSRGMGEVLEQLFAPFAAATPGRTRVGLGMAAQIVREHGGELRVSARGEWTAVVSLTLPVRGNEDRRRAGERRQGRRDRRKQA